MHLPAVALLALAVAQASSPSPDPGGIVREATRAVERDSAATLMSRWRQRLGRDSTDRHALLGAATIARLEYDFEAAERLYARLASDTTRQGLPYATHAAVGRAHSRLFRAPFDSAIAWYVRAAALARAAGDSSALGDAYLGIALAKLRMETPMVAAALVDSAARVMPARDSALTAWVRCSRAAVLSFLADPRTPAEATAGADLARQAGDVRRETFCLVMKGQYYLNSGEDAQAAALFERAVTLSREARDRSMLSLALWSRGHRLLEQYDHTGAERDLGAAVAEAVASGNRFIEGFAYVRLAVASWHFGDLQLARRRLERGRELLRDQGEAWGLYYILSIDAALALDAGDIRAADAAFRADLAWATAARQPVEMFNAHYGLARAAMREQAWARATAEFRAAEGIAKSYRLMALLPQLDYEYGTIALRSGDLAAAERHFRVLMNSSAGASDLDRYAARSRLAEIYLARGDVARAEREALSAADAVDSLRATLTGRDLRLLAYQAHKGYDDLDVGFATIVDGLVKHGRVEAALALAERRRARELRDRFVTASGDRAPASLAQPHRPGSPAEWLPDERTVLLEYVTGGGAQPGTLFAITSRGVTAVSVPPADSLARETGAFVSLIEAGAQPAALARQLGQVVLQHVLDSLPDDVTRIVVIPDGPLHRLPFDALRLADGRQVIERFAVSIAPSAIVLAALREQPTRRASSGTRILAIGDPRFPREVPATGSAAADVYRDAFTTTGGMVRLPASAREARLVARFGETAELRLRARASESYLKRTAVDSFDVLHFATHAVVDERSVTRSALALADGDGEDGFLSAAELQSLSLRASLVVLSACRTAGGVAVRGEGVLGLTAPLLEVGARSILATQWRIRDRDAVRFVEDFYRALSSGATVGDASRAAKLQAIQRGAPPSAWAAFSVIGDPLVTVPLRTPRAPLTILWIVMAVAVSLGFAFYGVRMRNRRGVDRASLASASRATTLQ